MKEHDQIKEPAEKIAGRKWRNNGIRQKMMEERNKPKRGDPGESEAEIAKVIRNEERRGSKVKRFENKFKRDIRQIMNEKANANLAIYAEFLRRRKIVLLREKLRRLKLQEETEKNKTVAKDLFGFPIE